MKIVKKTVFVASDGQEFDKKEACVVHEQTIEIVGFLYEDPMIDWRDCDANRVVERILEGYTVVPREDKT